MVIDDKDSSPTIIGILAMISTALWPMAYDWFLMLQSLVVESPSANVLDIVQSRHEKQQTFKTNEHVLMSLFADSRNVTILQGNQPFLWGRPFMDKSICRLYAHFQEARHRRALCQHFGFTRCEGLAECPLAALESHRVVPLSLNSNLLVNTTRASVMVDITNSHNCYVEELNRLITVGTYQLRTLSAHSAAICNQPSSNTWETSRKSYKSWSARTPFSINQYQPSLAIHHVYE